jgi:hypothetical protein
MEMSRVRILVLRGLAANLALCDSRDPRQDHIFELDEAGSWRDRGRVRGKALRDTRLFIENGPEHTGIHFLGRSDVDPHIRAFINHFCRKGVPAGFYIPGKRPICEFGFWVRDIVEDLARNTSVGKIMTIISDDLDLLLGVESAHDRIEAYGKTEELLCRIHAAICAEKSH